MSRIVGHDFGLFDVGAHGQRRDGVGVEEVVAEVEFRERERNAKFGLVGAEEGTSTESYE